MKDIAFRLKTLFEKHRVVFWYDDGGELKGKFEELALDVQKRVINNNEFSLKKEILRDKKDEKFLIYSDKEKPSHEDNWLLDLNLSNYIFKADKVSLILQTLELDVRYREFIESYKNFFNSDKRTQKLKELLSDDMSFDELGLIMIAVVLNSLENIDEITFKLLQSPKKLDDLKKYDLDREYFKLLKSSFGYDGDSFEDFIYKLFQNHFYYSFNKTKANLNTDAKLFLQTWMDSSRYGDKFEEYAKKVEKELNIEYLLDDDIEMLVDCDTYEICQKVLISKLIGMIFKDRLDSSMMQEVLDKKEHTFWFSKFKNIFFALLFAVKLSELIKEFKPAIKNFDDGIQNYTKEWYKIDSFYRLYSFYSSKSEHLGVLKELDEKIEDMYLNSFLRELNDSWQDKTKEYSVDEIQAHQQRFFKRYVEPINKNEKKVFVIISDAFRYECGVELSNKINTLDRYVCECEYMVSSLPSYTQLGMASLLPFQKLELDRQNDTVFIDKKSSSGLKNRDKILKNYSNRAVAINSEEFLKFKKEDGGREFVKNHSIMMR